MIKNTYINKGYNSFGITRIRGSMSNISNQWRPEAVLQLKDDLISFRPSGVNGKYYLIILCKNVQIKDLL